MALGATSCGFRAHWRLGLCEGSRCYEALGLYGLKLLG